MGKQRDFHIVDVGVRRLELVFRCFPQNNPADPQLFILILYFYLSSTTMGPGDIRNADLIGMESKTLVLI